MTEAGWNLLLSKAGILKVGIERYEMERYEIQRCCPSLRLGADWGNKGFDVWEGEMRWQILARFWRAFTREIVHWGVQS